MSKTYLANQNATEIFNVFQNFMSEAILQLEKTLKSSNTLPEAVHSFEMAAFDLTRSFELVDSEQKLKTAAIKSNILFEPKKFIIQQQTSQNIAEIEEDDVYGTIMPIKDQIIKFLELPNVLERIIETQNESLMSDNYKNLVNGTVWSDILTSYVGKTVIPIALYCDEFNADSVTSPHSADTKLNAFYYNFPTLPDFIAFNVRNIFIALLYKSKDLNMKEVDAHGLNPSLRALIEVLNPLAREGITVSIDGVKKQVYIVAPQFFGDNEAINSVYGFPRSFTANYACRICMIHQLMMQFSLEELQELIRNQENYYECVHGHNVDTKKGVKYDCILNYLDHFWVWKNISVDIMHDVFLGILKYDLIEILYYYLKVKKSFTLDAFNDKKFHFDYGTKSSGDKTADILENHITGEYPKIHMNAKEMWTLMEILPLILMELVTDFETCEIFKFVLVIVELIHLVTLKTYNDEDIAQMDRIIKKHHHMYLTLFERPNHVTHLVFKFHVMLHYERFIRAQGPLRNSMTFKFESKHQQLKRYARECFSRVNLPWSLCKKFCLEFSHYVSSKPDIFVEFEDASFSTTPGYVSAMENVRYCRKLDYKGYTYEIGDIIKKDEVIYSIRGIALENDNKNAFLYCQQIEVVFQDSIKYFEIQNFTNIFCEIGIKTVTRPVNFHEVMRKKYFIFRN